MGFDISEGEIIETSSGNLAEVLNTRTQIGWASPGHTGEEVPSYAHGPGCEWFGRYWDNTETSVGLANILGLDFEPGEEIDYDYRYDFDTAYE